MSAASSHSVDPFNSAAHTKQVKALARHAVSAFSMWGDDIWRFGCRNCYTWTGLPNPPELIDDVKLFVLSVHRENFRGRPAKPSSAANRSYAVRRFLRWMDHIGVERLSDLPPGFGFQYLEFLLEQPGVERLRDSSLARFLDVPLHIYEQAQVMRSAGRGSIQYHPYSGQSPYALGRRYGQEGGTIPPVPDMLFVSATSEVCAWVERYSVDVISMLVRASAERGSDQYNYDNWRAYGVNKALVGARFNATGVEWRAPLGEFASSELSELVKDLRAACVTAVLAFTGMRISEVLSLEAEPCDPGSGWPACLYVKPSRNGLMEIFYIRGKLIKGQDDFQMTDWVAGARPAGATHLPPPVKAILVLEELFRAWRANGETRLVLSQKWGGTGLPDVAPMKPCSYSAAAHDQVRFIARHVYARDPELAASIHWWRVSSHQWRKSFAQFLIRSDERLLRPISDHFKHTSLAMTSEGYVGNDVELLGLIDDEAVNRAAQVIMSAVSGELAIAGPLADIIDKQRERILQEVGRGELDKQIASLAELLRNDNVRTWDCAWGECFFRPETAQCHAEVNRTYTLTARRPNAEIRRPGLCCDCANLVVLAEHRPFWNSRLRKNELIMQSETDKNSASVRVAKRRVEQCKKILKRLDSMDVAIKAGEDRKK